MVGDVSVSLQAGQTVVVINFVDTGIIFVFSWLPVDGIFTGSKVVILGEVTKDASVVEWYPGSVEEASTVVAKILENRADRLIERLGKFPDNFAVLLLIAEIAEESLLCVDRLFAVVSERDSDSMVLRWVDLGAPETVFRWVNVVSALSMEDLCEVVDGLRWGSDSGGIPLVTWLVITVGLTVGLPLILELNNVV
jgi:hypothetical protein